MIYLDTGGGKWSDYHNHHNDHLNHDLAFHLLIVVIKWCWWWWWWQWWWWWCRGGGSAMTDTWILTPSSSPLLSISMAIFNHHYDHHDYHWSIILMAINNHNDLHVAMTDSHWFIMIIIMIITRTRSRGRSIWHVTLSYPADDCYACAAATKGC